MNQQIIDEISAFRMPAYREIPDVGLYLEQAQKFAAEYFKTLETISITTSMISNYVKKGLIKNPVKKQYNREQIAYILFIAVAKSVISLEEVQLLLDIQKARAERDSTPVDCEKAYLYFCTEFESALQYVFGLAPELPPLDDTSDQDLQLLRNLIITVAHKIYLDKAFALAGKEEKVEQ